MIFFTDYFLISRVNTFLIMDDNLRRPGFLVGDDFLLGSYIDDSDNSLECREVNLSKLHDFPDLENGISHHEEIKSSDPDKDLYFSDEDSKFLPDFDIPSDPEKICLEKIEMDAELN